MKNLLKTSVSVRILIALTLIKNLGRIHEYELAVIPSGSLKNLIIGGRNV